MNIGPGMSRRKVQYEQLKRELTRVIKSYCDEKSHLGWSSQAKQFVTEIHNWPSPSFDEPLFLKLYTKTTEFAQSLVSTGSYFASFFVSQETIGFYGCGSTLKERVEKVLSTYDPLNIQWIAFEISELKINQNVAKILYRTPPHTHYYPDLSSESKEVLRQALQVEALMTALKRGADGSSIAQVFDELVAAAKCADSLSARYTQGYKLK